MGKKFLYVIVRQKLEKDIIAASKAGDYLPPPATLCKRYGVSMITLNRALNDLSAAGVVKRIKHCGTKILRPASASSGQTLLPLHKKHCIRVLSVHPKRWQIMQILEQKFVDFCKYNNKYELQCEYAVRAEQLERLQLKDYDFIIADSGQVKLMMQKENIRNQFAALDKLVNFYFNAADYSPGSVKIGSDKNGRLYGLGLTVGPNLQLINLAPDQPQGLDTLSPYWSAWISQLKNFRTDRQPLLDLPLDWRYIEPIFRIHNIDIFDPDMQFCQLNTTAAKELLEEMAYYLHDENLLIHSAANKTELEEVHDSVLVKSKIPLKISSLILLKPGANCARFKIRPLPQARKKAAWLFWEGILVGKNCDRSLAGDLLNFMQSAAVQSSLQGCTGLPARLDMQKLMLAGCEQEFPGITDAFTQGMQFADNPYAVTYPVLQTLNLYFKRVFSGQEPVKKSLNNTVQSINFLLNKK